MASNAYLQKNTATMICILMLFRFDGRKEGEKIISRPRMTTLGKDGMMVASDGVGKAG